MQLGQTQEAIETYQVSLKNIYDVLRIYFFLCRNLFIGLGTQGSEEMRYLACQTISA